jgi:polyhydroxyalkanoate synthase
MGEYDHLIPPEASKPFNELVGSDDTEVIEYPTGHIGLAVSGSSHRDVWPRVAEWYIEKSTDDPDHLAEVETAVEESTDQIGIEEIDVDVDDLAAVEPDEGVTVEVTEPGAEEDASDAEDDDSATAEDGDTASIGGADLETVDGIGPAYAKRLRDGGIETVAELAGADPETVAEAADVGTTRAESWIASAQE